ncbi:MAG: hypothetical protein WAN86_11030 [Hyphomicrobiaceae bacterium]
MIRRLKKEDLRLPQQLCACRSPEEIRNVQVVFWQRAVEDYEKEFAVMAKFSSGFINNGGSPNSHRGSYARDEPALR